jgi:hypothetical protein
MIGVIMTAISVCSLGLETGVIFPTAMKMSGIWGKGGASFEI